MNPKNIDYFRTKFFLNNVNPPRCFRLQMHFARSVIMASRIYMWILIFPKKDEGITKGQKNNPINYLELLTLVYHAMHW